MNRSIRGHDKPHCDTSASLNNLGFVYQALGKLDSVGEARTEPINVPSKSRTLSQHFANNFSSTRNATSTWFARNIAYCLSN